MAIFAGRPDGQADVEREAARLMASGYCQISRRHRNLARIDDPDWRSAMGRHQTGGFPEPPERNIVEGMRWVSDLGASAADYYRRVLSRDVLEGVPQDVFDIVRRSGSDHGSEYRELVPPASTYEEA